jgi:SAM-dependent methyltransferase
MTRRAVTMPLVTTVRYSCVRCRQPLSVPLSGHGKLACAGCRFVYDYDNRYLRYEFDAMLFSKYRNNYLLNKVLNNNALISYQTLAEGSLSLKTRADVARVRDYVFKYARPGRLLDIGCGPLPLPGYLDFPDKERFELYGLDPIDDRGFEGTRIVGCSEFTPFADEQFDTIVFATSLDHVCSLDDTIRETNRILVNSGRVIIWMGDRSMSFTKRLKNWLITQYSSLKKGYRIDRYAVFNNFTVLYIPKRAVDPFHSYHESPAQTIALMDRLDFDLTDKTVNNPDEVFLCFTKRNHAPR